ncbi:hypothetical protein Val02_82300 [Virgisporangium aliadipatigenens]|uniref:Uncharacterized protein n=1 Tax=Virgisporangium aliadipatigenens TaxID=741659 RepID=A0A8J3YTD9_9ACTN|nr:hypothetical protein [Virgisporangium aliadipatigenens]GIJ51344.1 hypothetical protein Val02_82300 [Virgisporangium aliadipatigenens]
MGVYKSAASPLYGRSGMLPEFGTDTVHVPGTPDWRCIADGARWPCEAGRQRLTEQHADRPADLLTLMKASAERACIDLGADEPAAREAIHRHMVDWVPT